MASKAEVTPQKEEVSEKEGPETPPGSPLLDLSDAAIKKLIHSAKKRGYDQEISLDEYGRAASHLRRILETLGFEA
jgi:hypothetical protein